MMSQIWGTFLLEVNCSCCFTNLMDPSKANKNYFGRISNFSGMFFSDNACKAARVSLSKSKKNFRVGAVGVAGYDTFV